MSQASTLASSCGRRYRSRYSGTLQGLCRVTTEASTSRSSGGSPRKAHSLVSSTETISESARSRTFVSSVGSASSKYGRNP